MSHAPGAMKRCVHCGGPIRRRAKYVGCGKCRTRRSKERRRRFIKLRRQGFDNIQIANRENTSAEVVASELYRAKRWDGMDVPDPPYWDRGRGWHGERMAR